MKPEIILPYNPGTQNSDLKKANDRLTAAKTYKDLSTIIVTPTRGGRSLCPRFVSAMMGLMRPMNQMVFGPVFLSGMEVGDAFESAVDMILANPQLSKFKFLLTVEDDNLPPPDALLKIYEGMNDYDVIGGLYWTKGEGGQPMIYGNPYQQPLNFVPQAVQPETVQHTNGLGMGFTLFKMSVFKKVEKPWFKTEQSYNPNTGSRAYTQDLYFFEKLAKAGGRVACDTRVRIGHIDIEADQVW